MLTDLPILVVEDDPDGQAVVAHILSYMQIPHDVVGTAEHAINYLFRQGITYRAVIIDLALPGKDGWSLLSDIQRNPATRTLPCIAITAYHTSALREQALRAGFTAYFSKPIEATSFARSLADLLA
jgi:two-component system cell cycle response regulator DivK